MTAADVIRMLLEMDQQCISGRPSALGRAAAIVATLCEHAEPSLRRPDLLGDWAAIDLSAIKARAPREMDQPTMALAEEVDRLRLDLEVEQSLVRQHRRRIERLESGEERP